MSVFQAFILGIIQGVTEFIPVSSSGHLVLAEEFLGLKTSDFLAFDILVHAAALLALFAYFFKDWISILKLESKELLKFLILATLPAAAAGVLFRDFFEAYRSGYAVAVFMILTGVVFIIAEFSAGKKDRKKGEAPLTPLKAIFIGFFQAAALFPGISRSGMTICGGLFAGQKRADAARFSFLLGAIAILGATVLSLPDFFENGVSGVAGLPLFAGFAAAAFSGYASIAFLMRFLRAHSLAVFAVYLIAAGFLLSFA